MSHGIQKSRLLLCILLPMFFLLVLIQNYIWVIAKECLKHQKHYKVEKIVIIKHFRLILSLYIRSKVRTYFLDIDKY